MSRIGLDFAFTRTGLTVNERLVLVALCYKLPDHQRGSAVVSTVDSLVNLLEIHGNRIKSAIRGLEKGGHLSRRITRRGGKAKILFTINLVNPYIEESELREADRAMQYKVDLFQEIMKFYPVFEGRSDAWKAFIKLEPDDKMFLAIADDIQKRLTGEKPSLRGLHLSTYFVRRLWEL